MLFSYQELPNISSIWKEMSGITMCNVNASKGRKGVWDTFRRSPADTGLRFDCLSDCIDMSSTVDIPMSYRWRVWSGLLYDRFLCLWVTGASGMWRHVGFKTIQAVLTIHGTDGLKTGGHVDFSLWILAVEKTKGTMWQTNLQADIGYTILSGA